VWWAGVKSFLSPQAAADYEGVDPTAVPYTKIIGPAVVVPLEGPTDLITAVQIPTDAGIYMVYLETTETGLWVTRLQPPQQGQP
jgi:hypothetical protein